MFPIIGEVVIRTNGCNLIIDAASDDVQHFGVVNDLTITAVNSINCYHENGYLVNLVSFGTGKFKVESTAQLCQSMEELETILADKFGQKGAASQYEQKNPLIPDDPYAALVEKYKDNNFIFIDNGEDYGANNLPEEIYNKESFKILVNKNSVELYVVGMGSNVEFDLRGHSVSVVGDGIGAFIQPCVFTFKDSIGQGSLVCDDFLVLGDSIYIFESGNYVIRSFGSYGHLEGTIVIKGGSFNGVDYKSITLDEWKQLCPVEDVVITGVGTDIVTISQ